MEGLSLSGAPIMLGEIHGPLFLSVHPKSDTLLLKERPVTVADQRADRRRFMGIRAGEKWQGQKRPSIKESVI